MLKKADELKVAHGRLTKARRECQDAIEHLVKLEREATTNLTSAGCRLFEGARGREGWRIAPCREGCAS